MLPPPEKTHNTYLLFTENPTKEEINKIIKNSLPSWVTLMRTIYERDKIYNFVSADYHEHINAFSIQLEIDTYAAEKTYETLTGKGIDQQFVKSPQFRTLVIYGFVQRICSGADREFIDHNIGFLYEIYDQKNNSKYLNFKIRKGDCELLKNTILRKKVKPKIPAPKKNPSGRCGLAWGLPPCK
jgi:hypothetical protein